MVNSEKVICVVVAYKLIHAQYISFYIKHLNWHGLRMVMNIPLCFIKLLNKEDYKILCMVYIVLMGSG